MATTDPIPEQVETNEAMAIEPETNEAMAIEPKPARSRKPKAEAPPTLAVRFDPHFPVERITVDKAMQPRVTLDADTVGDYKDVIYEGGTLPPIDLFEVEDTILLADGFHRLKAFTKLGVLEIPANIRKGTRADAIMFAAGANQSHGLRRSNKDKRKAVEMIFTLMAETGDNWTDSYVAEIVGVSAMFVGNYRRESAPETFETPRVNKKGSVFAPPTASATPEEPLAYVEDDTAEAQVQPMAKVAEGKPAPAGGDKRGPIGVGLDRLNSRVTALTEAVDFFASIFPATASLGEALGANAATAVTFGRIRAELHSQLDRLNAIPLGLAVGDDSRDA